MADEKPLSSKASLRNSAVARLLLDGRASPTEALADTCSPDRSSLNSTPMDLSQRSVRSPNLDEESVRALGEGYLKSSPTSSLQEQSVAGDDTDMDSTRHEITNPRGNPDNTTMCSTTVQHPSGEDSLLLERDIFTGITREMESLQRLPAARVYNSHAKWRCHYCPFTAVSPRVLHSHYQFHQQLLTSGTGSQSHVEWLVAYRHTRERDDGDETAQTTAPSSCTSSSSSLVSSPGGGGDSYQSLRQLLAKGNEEQQQSASGFLRSIVRSIMQQGQEAGESGYRPPPGAASVSAPPGPALADTAHGALSHYTPGHVHAPIKIEPDSEADEQSSGTTDVEALTVHSLSSSQGDDVSKEEPTLSQCLRDDRACARTPPARHFLPSALYEDSGGVLRGVKRGPDDDGGGLVRQQLRSMIDRRRYPDTPGPSQLLPTGPLEPVLPPLATTSRLEVLTTPADTSRQYTTPPINVSPHPKLKDACVQCELLTAAHDTRGGNPWESSTSEMASSELMLQDVDCGSSSLALNPKCQHCGIQFDDEVLFSIHMGCHSHRDPFICNVCGKHCGNRYGFYTHIMRGHHN